jgi:adenylylsulfate kinase
MQGRTTMLVAMAGLPGTGKSTLAARLAQRLGGVVLSKDEVRAALFPRPVLDYSREQDDVCMTAIYQAAARILTTDPGRTVVLDGRTFLRSYQVRDLLALAASVSQAPHLIECVCDDDTARQRLEAQGEHPAANRDFTLYRTLRAAAEPIPLPHLTLDTGRTPLQECVERCLAYLRGG